MKDYDLVFLIYALRKRLFELREKKSQLLGKSMNSADAQKKIFQMNLEIGEIEGHLKSVNN